MNLSNIKEAPGTIVGAGAVAGALTIIVAWLVKTYGHTELTAEVAGAIQMIITYIAQQIHDDNTPPSK